MTAARAQLDPASRCPLRLSRLMQAFIAEEVRAGLRHSVRNKLSSIRNATFYLQQKIEKNGQLVADSRVPAFLQLIDTELADTARLLSAGGLLPEPAAAATTDVRAALEQLSADEPVPHRLVLNAPQAIRAKVDLAELQVAVFCLLENAADAQASANALALEVEEKAGTVVVSVLDRGCGLPQADAKACLRPFFTTRSGRLGAGLNVAQRVGERFAGKLGLAPREGGGVRAWLSFPAEAR